MHYFYRVGLDTRGHNALISRVGLDTRGLNALISRVGLDTRGLNALIFQGGFRHSRTQCTREGGALNSIMRLINNFQ